MMFLCRRSAEVTITAGMAITQLHDDMVSFFSFRYRSFSLSSLIHFTFCLYNQFHRPSSRELWVLARWPTKSSIHLNSSLFHTRIKNGAIRRRKDGGRQTRWLALICLRGEKMHAEGSGRAAAHKGLPMFSVHFSPRSSCTDLRAHMFGFKLAHAEHQVWTQSSHNALSRVVQARFNRWDQKRGKPWKWPAESTISRQERSLDFVSWFSTRNLSIGPWKQLEDEALSCAAQEVFLFFTED